VDDYRRVVPTERPEWVDRLEELHLLTLLRILAIIVVAIVLAIVLRALVTRLLSRTIELPGTDRARSEARQRALATALGSAAVGVIWAIAVITIIGELGLNIGGVIATATVIGGAIAFGAQTLIRDVIAGLFVLAEDQYGVGDRVDLGHASGVVDRITLRSVRLHDGEGRVWHVPHGNVLRIANLSSGSLALLDIEVSRESDPAIVEQVAARLGRRLHQHSSVGPLLTGDPTVVGLTDVLDDRLIYRISAPTLPGRQDDVRRVWRTLALGAFREGELREPGGAPTVVHSASSGSPPGDPDAR
jgi:small conductance mechanosensitive channel